MEFDLRDWLFEEIGLEHPVERRRNLFKKLLRLHQRHGLTVVRIIAAAWEFAQQRADKDLVKHCFCRTVKLKLIDAKLWEEGTKYDAMELTDIIKTGIFKRQAPLPLFDDKVSPAQVGESPKIPGHGARCTILRCFCKLGPPVLTVQPR